MSDISPRPLRKINHAYILESNSQVDLEDKSLRLALDILGYSIEEKKDNISLSNPSMYNIGDLRIIESDKKNITIGQVRQVIGDLYTKPLAYEKKVYLFMNAESMNQEGQNAILKSLEDPPEYVVFILATTNVNKLLPTIVSRCEKIFFSSKNVISEVDELNLYRIFDNLLAKKSVEIFKNKDFFMQYKDMRLDFFKSSLDFFRDILRYKCTGSSFLTKREYESLIIKNSYLPLDRLERIILRIEELNNLSSVNINFQLAVESMLIEIMEG